METSSQLPPKSKKKQRWTRKSTLYIFYMFMVLSFMDIFDSYTTIFPPTIISFVQDEFITGVVQNDADSTMALVLAIASLGTYFAVINQYLSDRFGRRIFLFITLLGMGLSSLIIALSNSLSQFTIGFFFMYVFFSTDMFIIYISEESPVNRRGININIIMILGCLGSIAVPIMRSIFVTETSSNWRAMAFFATCAIPLSFFAFGLKETTKFQELKKLRATSTQNTTKISPLVHIKKLFTYKYRKAYLSLLVLSFFSGINGVFVQLGELFLSNHENLTQSDINLIITSMGVATMVGFLLTGYLADKFGRKPLCYIYCALIPVSLLLVVLGVEIPKIAVFSCCIGASLTSMTYYGLGILTRIICVEILPTDIRGMGSSIRTMVSALGITLGLFINSWLNRLVGLGKSFLILSVLLVVCIPILYFLIKETKGIELDAM